MSTHQVMRDRKVAEAVRKHIIEMEAKMESCLRQSESAFRLGDAFLAEFDDIAADARRLREGLQKLELRLQRAGAYFVSQEQTDQLLAIIAEVGADTAKFCHWMGVDAVAQIAAHDFKCAVAALEAKRAKEAA